MSGNEREAKLEVHDLLFHEPAKPARLMNPVVLAYAGDAVYELLVRQYLISKPNHKSHELHREATRRVSAKAQRLTLERLMPLLTEEEADIVRRGRNAKSGSPPKNADPADYRHATALEALFGYLFYERRGARIGELLAVALDEEGLKSPQEEL
ncbi:Mini-ribonuclease 3 [Paenibacillus xylaniclasticus]|uniref:Mini-ribonuclease 3 n=1 Tax=Paenibacillus xylaniclasticus TaxID=588083 RepID=UPI000FDB55F1|nr:MULTISPECIES: ribonuclease III domain-containing protein [Paenibacillus]GFN33398.1 mini-ribonuclease 3 [Paenibacillus curdlanolyticus]